MYSDISDVTIFYEPMQHENATRKREIMMKELVKTLKKLSWNRWEKSLIDIKKFDPEYEQAMDKVVEFEKRYADMALSKEDRSDIDGFLDALDDVGNCEINLAYLVGMADCLLILDRLELFQL